MMRSWDALPRAPLRAAGDCSAQFTGLGLADYQTAARHIGKLPYGRNSDRAGFRLVIPERRGTCSTKHALLATLATEQELPVSLTLGIYQMNERNTPGVGAVLDEYGLAFIPEAHCYLSYAETRIDVTRSSVSPVEPITAFLHEERIVPEQIGAYEVDLHKRFMREWAAGLLPSLNWDDVWEIREACIAALDETG